MCRCALLPAGGPTVYAYSLSRKNPDRRPSPRRSGTHNCMSTRSTRPPGARRRTCIGRGPPRPLTFLPVPQSTLGPLPERPSFRPRVLLEGAGGGHDDRRPAYDETRGTPLGGQTSTVSLVECRRFGAAPRLVPVLTPSHADPDTRGLQVRVPLPSATRWGGAGPGGAGSQVSKGHAHTSQRCKFLLVSLRRRDINTIVVLRASQ